MTESFAQLFEESLKEIETRPGSIVRGVVVAIDKDVVLVDAGLKSESAIPAEQFKNAQGELEIQVGDEVDVALDASRWKKLTKMLKLLPVLSTAKLRAASLLS